MFFRLPQVGETGGVVRSGDEPRPGCQGQPYKADSRDKVSDITKWTTSNSQVSPCERACDAQRLDPCWANCVTVGPTWLQRWLIVVNVLGHNVHGRGIS